MNTSKVPVRDEKRDNELIKDYLSGKFSSVDLVSKYQITVTRIYEILNFHKIERKTKKVNN